MHVAASIPSAKMLTNFDSNQKLQSSCFIFGNVVVHKIGSLKCVYPEMEGWGQRDNLKALTVNLLIVN